MPIAATPLMDDTDKENQLANPFFADLVVLAGGLNPFPYRTRPLNSPAPMVLSLKAWKSRSLPGLPRTDIPSTRCNDMQMAAHEGGHSHLRMSRNPSCDHRRVDPEVTDQGRAGRRQRAGDLHRGER